MSVYKQIADEHMKKLNALRADRDRIEEQIVHVQQLVKAAVNLMPEEERDPYLNELALALQRNRGLTDAIRTILQEKHDAFTAMDMKEALDKKGYDFTRYTSNPLSSIHAVLKRFKSAEVERTYGRESGDVGYRWKKKKVDRK